MRRCYWYSGIDVLVLVFREDHIPAVLKENNFVCCCCCCYVVLYWCCSGLDIDVLVLVFREDHIPADLKENNFVCKLCKTFCGIKQKSLQPDYLKNHKTHKAFYKDYRRRYISSIRIRIKKSCSICKKCMRIPSPALGIEFFLLLIHSQKPHKRKNVFQKQITCC